MFESYVSLALAALLAPAAAAALYLLEQHTSFGKLGGIPRQILYGILFGCIAIYGTECGIPLENAQLNCRDAAVLIAGLMFGAPAGIIAGVIGGVERWIAVSWGIGSFTRLACSASTIFAGIYAAFLRKFMFEDKKPGWLISFAIGVVMEIVHMTAVFITNMDTPEQAMAVVHTCAAPMALATGFSVMLACFVLTLMSGELRGTKQSSIRISQTIQRWLLVTVLLAFAATSYFLYQLQDAIAVEQRDSLLKLALDEISADIRDASDNNLLRLARNAEKDAASDDLQTVADRYGLAEISIINSQGIITESTESRFLGYDMASGEQSAAFLCLLGDTDSFVQEYMPISYDQSTMRKYAGIKTANGCFQVGYDAEQFQKDIDTEIVGITKNRHVGQTGYVLILDRDLQFLSVPESLAEKLKAEQNNSQIEIPAEDSTFPAVVDDKDVFCRYQQTEGYYIVSVLPKDEALQVRNIALYVNTFMEILVFAALFGLTYRLIKRVVVNQIKHINRDLGNITAGNLDVAVNVRTNEEFAILSDDINATVNTMKNYIAEASARIDRELELAKNIQTSALPNIFPAFPQRKEFDIFASMNPAKEVGGDFYDFYLTHDDTLHFLIADVSGKGIPAAMFMMRAKTELKSRTETDIPLSDVFTEGNTALCEGNDAGMFVTAWQGGIDLESGVLHYVNAGHNPPLLRRANGKFEFLRTRSGFILAGMEGMRYKMQELEMQAGDTLFLYTDGVTEAKNDADELFGEERLLTAINSKPYTDMRSLCELISAEVAAFVGEIPQFDDITMVALQYFGKPPVPTIRFERAAVSDIPAVTDFVDAELEKIGASMKVITQFNVAIDEIYSNIVRYGYSGDFGPITVSVIYKENPAAVYLRFADQGIPYNPLSHSDPDISLSAEERDIGGLGIFMVKKTMDDVKYRYEKGCNTFTIKKFL